MQSIVKTGYIISITWPDGEMTYKFVEGTEFQAEEEIKYLKRTDEGSEEKKLYHLSNYLTLKFNIK